MRRPLKMLLLAASTGAFLWLPPMSGTSHATDQTPQVIVPAPTTAQPMACGARNEMVRTLREKFGETPVAHGLANSGVLAEIFSSPQGTWTIVATTANGVSCLIGSGQSFQTTLAMGGTI